MSATIRYGWPVLSLLSEPFKIVQAPKETMIVYETITSTAGLHRRPQVPCGV